MFRKLLLTLSLMLIIPLSSFAKVPYNPNADTSKISFSDVADSHWAKETISKLAAQETKILNGYPDGTFKPQKAMSRAEFVTVLIRARDVTPSDYSTFPDVPKSHWASKHIGTAQKLGIIETGDYNNFMPNGEITRYEVAKMIAYSSDNTKKIVNNDQRVKSIFKDETQDDKSKKIINIMAGTQIMNGFPDGTIGLDKTATRAEISAMILRYIEKSDLIDSYSIPEGDISTEPTEQRKEGYVGGTWTTYADLLPSKFHKLENGTGVGSKVLDFELTVDKVKAFRISKSKGIDAPVEYQKAFENFKDIYNTQEAIKYQILRVIKNGQDFSKYMYTFDECNVIAIDYTISTNSATTLSTLGSVPQIREESNGDIFATSFYSTIAIEQYKAKKELNGNIELYKDKSLNKYPGSYIGRFVQYGDTYKYTQFIMVNKLPESCTISLWNDTSDDQRCLDIVYGK